MYSGNCCDPGWHRACRWQRCAAGEEQVGRQSRKANILFNIHSTAHLVILQLCPHGTKLMLIYNYYKHYFFSNIIYKLFYGQLKPIDRRCVCSSPGKYCNMRIGCFLLEHEDRSRLQLLAFVWHSRYFWALYMLLGIWSITVPDVMFLLANRHTYSIPFATAISLHRSLRQTLTLCTAINKVHTNRETSVKYIMCDAMFRQNAE